MTSGVIYHAIQNLRLSIHVNFYQNWFINEYDRENLVIISKMWKDGLGFNVRLCRRTYALKKLAIHKTAHKSHMFKDYKMFLKYFFFQQ